MRIILFVGTLLFRAIVLVFKGSLYVFQFIVDVIDGGEECEDDFDPQASNYNFRTSELDPVERTDGIYDNER